MNHNKHTVEIRIITENKSNVSVLLIVAATLEDEKTKIKRKQN